jgi:hypothetical protein
MDEAAKKKLEELLQNHDEQQADLQEKRAEAAEAAEKEKAAAEQFIEENIKPVLEEIAAALKEKGHQAWVSPEGASCRIEMFPSSAKGGGFDHPNLVFYVGKDQIGMSGSNVLPGRGGTSGGRGSIPRTEFSPDLVAEKTLEWLREVFEGPWR